MSCGHQGFVRNSRLTFPASAQVPGEFVESTTAESSPLKKNRRSHRRPAGSSTQLQHKPNSDPKVSFHNKTSHTDLPCRCKVGARLYEKQGSPHNFPPLRVSRKVHNSLFTYSQKKHSFQPTPPNARRTSSLHEISQIIFTSSPASSRRCTKANNFFSLLTHSKSTSSIISP